MARTMLLLVPFVIAEVAFADPLAVPAGTFVMGGGRGPDDPAHVVALSAFRVDATEVSVGAFEAFAAEGYARPELWSDEGRTWLAAHPQGAGAEQRAAGRGADHPVVAVTWYEADAYCRWRGGALPTEAQWERAACGEGGRRFPWGEEETAPPQGGPGGVAGSDGVGWYHGGKYGTIQQVETLPVDRAGPTSPWGALHMAGNVWEWTADWYHRDAYAEHAPLDPAGPATGTWRTLRGGSYMNLPSYCTCWHREPARPERVAFTTGFRCAYPAESQP